MEKGVGDMILKKIIQKQKFYDKPFWKRISLILAGFVILSLGLIGYFSLKVSGKVGINYYGEDIFLVYSSFIFIGGFLLVLGVIKFFKKIK